MLVGRRGRLDTDPRRENLGLTTGGIVSSTLALIVVVPQIVGIVTLTVSLLRTSTSEFAAWANSSRPQRLGELTCQDDHQSRRTASVSR